MRKIADSVNGWRYLLLIPLIVFFALSWQKSFTGDEGLTVYLASGSYSHLLTNIGADFHVPGYYTGLWLVLHTFGSSMLVLRLFSLLLILLMVTLAIRHLSFPAALFLALSPFTLHLAIEIRMYAMLALLGLLLILAYRRYEKLQSRSSLAILILTLSACTWVHYFGWIGTAAVVSMFLLKRKWKYTLIVLLSVIVLFLPWTGNLVSRTTSPDTENTQVAENLPIHSSLQQRLKGMPLSMGGTALRFAGGTATFDFDQWGIRSIPPAGIAGMITGLFLLLLLVKGFSRTDGICRSILLWSFLGLSFIRPTARHFAVAFPAYMVIASAGLPSSGNKRKIIVILLGVFMLLLCIPFTLRSTIPQRCTFDRDYLQVSQLAMEESRMDSLPVIIFMDSYSVLGVKMHMDEEGFPENMVWHPHISFFQQGKCFYGDVWQGVSYLQQDTDSLVSHWIGLSGSRRGFVLIANRPGTVPGRIFGTGENRFIGLGSDVMADIDLMRALEHETSVREIDLPGDRGPLSLFVCTWINDSEPR